jgi:hypothetical protein
VSSVSVSGSGAGSKRALTAVLGVLGLIAVVIGILYFTVKGLPSFLTAGSHLHGKSTTHDLRGAVAVVVGVALFVGAWWTSKKK